MKILAQLDTVVAVCVCAIPVALLDVYIVQEFAISLGCGKFILTSFCEFVGYSPISGCYKDKRSTCTYMYALPMHSSLFRKWRMEILTGLFQVSSLGS